MCPDSRFDNPRSSPGCESTNRKDCHMSKKIELSAALRELADRIDASDVSDDARVRLEVSAHGIQSIEDLGQITRLIDSEIEAYNNDEVCWVQGYIEGQIRVTAFYKAGLLGTTRKKKYLEKTVEVDTDVSGLPTYGKVAS